MIDSKSNGSGLVPGKDWSSLSAPFGGYSSDAVPGRGPGAQNGIWRTKMLKSYTPSEYRVETAYELTFDDGCGNGFGFLR